MRFLSFILFCFACFSSSLYAGTEKPKVAVIISSYASDVNEKVSENLSYDLEELAQAYLVLRDNGVAIDIISPKGGAVLVKKNKDNVDFIQRFKQQTPALKQLAKTIASHQAKPKQYNGVLVIGGNGAMFDLPKDRATQEFLSHFAHNEQPIAAVCHGPAALVNLKDKHGEFWLKGKRVNSFTNLEEQAFGGDVIEQLPFLLEDKLKQRGAMFQSNRPMLPFVAVDGNLITAQNPMAVAKAAEALLTKMGVKVKPREMFKDEATLDLVMRARNSGSYLIDIELAATPEKFDSNYLALYGFYSYKLATEKVDQLKEIELMQAIGRHFEHPMYAASLIKALHEQGFIAQAKTAFTEFKLQYADSDQVKPLQAMFD